MAQSLTLPTTNKIQDDRHPHLVSLRKTLVILEPMVNEVLTDELITVIAKNTNGETVHQTVMRLPSQQPKIASQLDIDTTKSGWMDGWMDGWMYSGVHSF